MVVPEAPLEMTKFGLRPGGPGWFVVNARELRWRDTGGFGAFCDFEGKRRFPDLGINLNVLQPGQPMGMYHRENRQEGFLVLAGKCLLIVESEERAIRAPQLRHRFVQRESLSQFDPQVVEALIAAVERVPAAA